MDEGLKLRKQLNISLVQDYTYLVNQTKSLPQIPQISNKLTVLPTIQEVAEPFENVSNLHENNTTPNETTLGIMYKNNPTILADKLESELVKKYKFQTD
jgi:hypothetical protein